MAIRRQNFQNISWFWDLRQRNRLDMDPPYQRRSVWSDRYRQQFIDTVLMDYPAPAIFLFSSISVDGITSYQLVDGKQRLTAIYDFIEGRLPVGDDSPLESLRGQYFAQLSEDIRLRFYDYNFSVEYLPTNNEDVVNGIFDRLNRNVARLTAQELRHARFSGPFISTAERLADWMTPDFEALFPRIANSSRRQMKDVEFVATLLLLLEEGPKGYSVSAMDAAFSSRDEQWDFESQYEEEFRQIVQYLRDAARTEATFLPQSRLRNQTDYYSLFGALSDLKRDGLLPAISDAAPRLEVFLESVEDQKRREGDPIAQSYYDASRSASTDAGPRADRIAIMKDVLMGRWPA